MSGIPVSCTKTAALIRGAIAALVLLASPAFGGESAAHYTGPKKTVFVSTFESANMLYGQATGEGLSQMLLEAIMADGRFVAVERLGYADIEAEQQLGKAGLSTAETAPKQGQMLGASVIIRGTVTKFDPKAKGGGISLGSGLFGGNSGLGMSGNTAVVEISLRLIDAATGRVISTSKAEGSASSKEFNATLYSRGDLQIGSTQFHETPLGQAAEQAIQSALAKIVTGMETVPWSALVIENTGGVVYVNAGADQNVTPGMTLGVYRKTKELTDPATGAVIDTLVDKVGTVQIDNVRDKTSLARATAGEPVRGDMLRLP
jgi:curli biogenesis system outer membrane secretion channel CsgG